MNFKLEKFWNHLPAPPSRENKKMNFKLEKFWNKVYVLGQRKITMDEL